MRPLPLPGDALRLCLGTLTVLPVAPPRRLDRRTAGGAMLLAPLAGVLLAVPAALVLVALAGVPLLAAALALAVLATATRGLHLDGLADTADGLGSGRPAAGALEVMRRSDVGPFGVVTLVLALLAQAAALAHLVAAGAAVPALVVALAGSRTVLPLLCRSGTPSARPDGLGHLVAGSVRPAAAVAVAVLVIVASAALGLAAGGLPPLVAVVAVAAALAAGLAFAAHCVRRLGGVTGDVLGAAVEVAFTACLVVTSAFV